MTAKKLTIKQKRFVEAMANPKTRNQTEAAIKAGCPPKNARITASRWLTKANILEAINERKRKAIAHAEITPEELVGAAAFQMRSSIADVLDDSGSFCFEKARKTGAVDLIKKHKVTSRTVRDKDGEVEVIKTIEVEMHSSAQARKELAAYLGINKKL